MICMTVVLWQDCIDSVKERFERSTLEDSCRHTIHKRYWRNVELDKGAAQTLFAPNCTLAFPLTKVALICMMTDSIE